MNKKVLFGSDARNKLLSGINKITDAIASTIGPLGRLTMICQSVVVDYGVHSLPTLVTKDGHRTAQAFDISDDPFEQAGALMVKEASRKTVELAGDGTSTTAVLLRAIVSDGMKLIDNGSNPMALKRGIDKAVEYVVDELKKVAVPIKGDIEKIRQIATISANNDAEIGKWIADAFEKIGEDGVIDLEASKSVKTEIKILEGYSWSNGWVSPLFVSNKEKNITEFTDPLILLYDKRITHHTQVQRALEVSMQQGKPILIVCDDADEQGLAFLAMNTLQGRIQCCVVKSPSFGEGRRMEMEDIAILTGGTYISDTRGISINDIELKHFGKAKKAIISKDETIIIGGASDEKKVKSLLHELRANVESAKDEEEKAPIEKRIAKLTGGVAVIQVGAATETEMKEKLDRFDDAVRAVKAAISEGYVVGSGTAFLRVKKKGGDAGWNLIMSILDKPLRQICKNAGVDEDEKVTGVIRAAKNSDKWGYNAKADAIEDLENAGVIDPVKVLRCALQNAASSASMVLTSEVLIVDTL